MRLAVHSAPPASCLASNTSPRILLPPDNKAVIALVARRTVPLTGRGAGATGALCAGREGFFGSTSAKRTVEKLVTRNWGMTMKMLRIPYFKDDVKKFVNRMDGHAPK